ncbi:hypothetical protein FA95DRAFT_865053 [Auriscalpium vulgare]|uniref:Uncharacterized protein n=1 Tax=Auriscalpium vulgare TaxID=40419 RepID=A0ACB8R8Q6_9AGAM|nr:hypothetical protein FA95DRAFT_865053 [Auriscalpium vulgare]
MLSLLGIKAVLCLNFKIRVERFDRDRTGHFYDRELVVKYVGEFNNEYSDKQLHNHLEEICDFIRHHVDQNHTILICGTYPDVTAAIAALILMFTKKILGYTYKPMSPAEALASINVQSGRPSDQHLSIPVSLERAINIFVESKFKNPRSG